MRIILRGVDYDKLIARESIIDSIPSDVFCSFDPEEVHIRDGVLTIQLNDLEHYDEIMLRINFNEGEIAHLVDEINS